MTKEQAILNYMKSLKISREEAEQLWLDDKEDFIGEEGEKMTENAKKIQHREKSDKPKAKSNKVRKVDNTKKFLLETVENALSEMVDITNVKTETEISFNFQNEKFTIKLTRHRK